MIIEWKRNLGQFARPHGWYWIGLSLMQQQRISITSVTVTIDGGASHVLTTQNDAVVLVSDGTNWFVVADFP